MKKILMLAMSLCIVSLSKAQDYQMLLEGLEGLRCDLQELALQLNPLTPEQIAELARQAQLPPEVSLPKELLTPGEKIKKEGVKLPIFDPACKLRAAKKKAAETKEETELERKTREMREGKKKQETTTKKEPISPTTKQPTSPAEPPILLFFGGDLEPKFTIDFALLPKKDEYRLFYEQEAEDFIKSSDDPTIKVAVTFFYFSKNPDLNQLKEQINHFAEALQTKHIIFIYLVPESMQKAEMNKIINMVDLKDPKLKNKTIFFLPVKYAELYGSESIDTKERDEKLKIYKKYLLQSDIPIE